MKVTPFRKFVLESLSTAGGLSMAYSLLGFNRPEGTTYIEWLPLGLGFAGVMFLLHVFAKRWFKMRDDIAAIKESQVDMRKEAF